MTTVTDEAEDADLEDAGEALPMAFTTKKFVLEAKLERAGSVIPTQDVIDVLKNYLIVAEDGRLRIMATDMALSLVASTDVVEVSRPGTAVVNGKRLLAVVREAEEGDVSFEVVGGEAVIRVGRSQWKLLVIDPDRYPDMPDSEVEFQTVNRPAFLSALNSVRKAAMVESVRPAFQMVDVTAGTMRASDAVRMHQVEGLDLPDMQLPMAAVPDLVRLLGATELATFDVGQTEEHLVFRVGDDVFVASKLVAEFPDLDDMLLRPALANEVEMSVVRNDLVKAVKRVRITADEETSAITLDLARDALTVGSRDKLGNEAEVEVDARYEGPKRQLAVNHRQFLDMLTSVDVTTCQFRLGKDSKTKRSSILLTDEEGRRTAVLNQMRPEYVK